MSFIAPLLQRLQNPKVSPLYITPLLCHQRSYNAAFRRRERHSLANHGRLLIRRGLQCPKQGLMRHDTRRSLSTDVISTIAIPPAIFVGLLLGLWTYKCIMMVMFQNRIIYMPSMPPFARSEKIEDYAPMCRPVDWHHKSITSLDGTQLVTCVGEVPDGNISQGKTNSKHVVICYFQGNGGSLPPRLPTLSSVLKSLHARRANSNDQVRYSIVALSYRGYWTSSGRPSQGGIEMDAQALLSWVFHAFGQQNSDLMLILWGQSIGAGIACTALATYLELKPKKHGVDGLILETPFVSIKSMLIALYPQTWLPYRYLAPFLWNHWDTEGALRRIAKADRPPNILLLSAGKDEIVPAAQVTRLEQVCWKVGLGMSQQEVKGALHTEAASRIAGRQAVVKFINQLSSTRS